VERSGKKKEVIASTARGGEVVLVVRVRTRGDWQTSITYGEPHAPEEHPTRFWVLVDLYPDVTYFYIVPEWWMANDASMPAVKPWWSAVGGRRRDRRSA
jgi:hypothetical protein